MEIRYLVNEDIDRQKWDKCVAASAAALPYGFSWYLDCVAPNWAGLVYDDYKAVFPLPWKNLLLFRKIYQPFFTQQLGVFGKETYLSEELTKAFLDAIPAEFKLVHLYMNPGGGAPSGAENEATKRLNLIINLNKNYEDLRINYKQNLLRSLKKAEQSNLSAPLPITPEVMIDLFEQVKGSQVKVLSEQDYVNLLLLMKTANENNAGEALGVFDADGEIQAAAYFLKNKKRIINLINVSTEKGRKNGAAACLFNQVIQDNSGKEMVFDFEGSQIPNIARFYKSFGATPEYYWEINRNLLPWHVKRIWNTLISLRRK